MKYFYIKETRRPKRKKPLLAFLFTFLLLITVFTFSYKTFIKQNDTSTLAVTDVSYPSPTPDQVTPTQQKNNLLKIAVQDALVGTTGTYGIVVKNLKNEISYYSNEHKVFDAASLYKLWVMAATYQQIQAGKLAENQILSEDIKILNDKFQIAAQSAEKTEGTITSSVSEALNKMITVSDNYSALLLAEKLRLSTVATFLKTNGFTESSIGANGKEPTTTAYDIAMFFEKLYKGGIANEEHTKSMIELLKTQRLNSKLPKHLPEGVVVAHKTGELDSYSHDAGIVYIPSEDYVIAILSQSNNRIGANERIARISKNVYDYFSKLQ